MSKLVLRERWASPAQTKVCFWAVLQFDIWTLRSIILIFAILEARKPKGWRGYAWPCCPKLCHRWCVGLQPGPAAVHQRSAAAWRWRSSSEVARVCQTHSCATDAAVKSNVKPNSERAQPGFRVAANGMIPREKVTLPSGWHWWAGVGATSQNPVLR